MSTFCFWLDTPTRPCSPVREDSVSLTGFPRRPSRAQPADCAGFRTVRSQRFLVFFVVSDPFPFPPASYESAPSTAVNPSSVFHVSHFCSTVDGSPRGCNQAPIFVLSSCLLLPYHGVLSLTRLPTTSWLRTITCPQRNAKFSRTSRMT